MKMPLKKSGKPAALAVDAKLIRQLADILHETGLGEIEYADGDRRIRVARPAAAPGPAVSVAMPAPTPVTATAGAGDGGREVPIGAITSPMVGTVYLSPAPGAAPFVKPGDRVNEGQTVLIVEAMKVMNPIKSARAGTVTRILVENGSPVEYGEPLMVIE
jgi:acetyl-CoA carboxylase biotin carboxyl carrier protein